MAPIFPMGLINQGWYLVIIFFIGLFFGLVLEQSGFSSSRKLAGIFYAYDFVVLKVFFTAGITAMSGLVILGYLGWIDLSTLYINSNFLVSAVLGGVVMGFGFVIGGFCPGTSITGAVIGKIDAMIFIVGVFLGIFVFGAFNHTFHKLFTGHYFDRELLSDTLGISKHLLVFIFILMALAAFGVGSYFEKRATQGIKPTNKKYPRYGAEIFMAVAIAAIILFLPQHKSKALKERCEKGVLTTLSEDTHLMTPDELAYLILNNPQKLNIVDVRDEGQFRQFHFPEATNVPLRSIPSRNYSEIFSDYNRKTVLVSNGGVEASEAFVLLSRKGYDNIYVLKGGINGFISTIYHNNTMPDGTTAYDEISKYRFRKRAARAMSQEGGDLLQRSSVKKQSVPVLSAKLSAGGC